MLSRKVELIILNAVLIAGITASGIAAWNNDQSAQAAPSATVINSGQSNSELSFDETSNDLSITDKNNPAAACGNGCSNCSACTGQCRVGRINRFID